MNTAIVLRPVSPWPRRAAYGAGALLLAAAAFGAGSWWQGRAATPAPALAAVPAPVVPAAAASMPAEVAPAPVAKAPAPTPKPQVVARPKPVSPEPTRPVAEAPREVVERPIEREVPLRTRPVAAVCYDCGIVEAVRPVVQKGEGSGIGAVAGGVVGGALGNQVGKGNGRKAMTVIGAIGGGMLGHEIEKRQRSTTVYEMRIRMEDGSVRTVTQATEVAAGTRVTVEGDTVRVRTERSGRTGDTRDTI
jgi:outer membrane lipoprotein SlyB